MQFSVQNMSCNHCERAITAALRRLDANAEVRVDVASGIVEADGRFGAEQVVAALAAEGYPAQAAAQAGASTCCGHCPS